MEKLVRRGLVRAIGTSNMTIPKLRLLLRDAEIAPSCNEMELHPHFQQPELYRFVIEHGMVPIGFCPIGSPTRPDRDRTPEDTVDIEDPVIVRIARGHGVHPAVVCVAWAVQRGQVPIPFSVHRSEFLANIRACSEPLLTPAEMREMAAPRPRLQAHQGTGLPLEGRSELGGALGSDRRDHAPASPSPHWVMAMA